MGGLEDHHLSIGVESLVQVLEQGWEDPLFPYAVSNEVIHKRDTW